MGSREDILGRVRDAITAHPPPPVQVPRTYRRHSADDLKAFLGRLDHYGAKTHCVGLLELDAAVRRTLTAHGARRVVAPSGVPDTWLLDSEPLRDVPPLPLDVLDGADGLISTCAVAVAMTGTIVLDGGEGMGRRALSLLPDYHLCVVRREQIVGSLPEAIDRLTPTRPLTFISGPSATVDIELVRVAGVHGPRTLEVIVALDESSEAEVRDQA